MLDTDTQVQMLLEVTEAFEALERGLSEHTEQVEAWSAARLEQLDHAARLIDEQQQERSGRLDEQAAMLQERQESLAAAEQQVEEVR